MNGLSASQSLSTWVPINFNAAPSFLGGTSQSLTTGVGQSIDLASYLHVGDSDASQTETWTQSGAPNNGGSLTITGATATSGSTDIVPGGTTTYTPAAGFSGTETFSIQVSDGTATATKTFTITINDPPTITGTAAGQAVDDNATVAPFASVTLGDNGTPAQTESVTVTLDTAAKGGFTTLNGFVNAGGGVYTFSGTAAAATSAIQGLVFTPTAHRVAPGNTETTTFTISVNDGVAGAVSDGTTTVVTTAVNNAPGSADATVTAVQDNAYTFVPGNFTFSDVDFGASLQAVRLATLPGKGSVTLSGVAVTVGQGIGIADISAGNLKWAQAVAGENGAGYTGFTFQVSDGALWSSPANTVTVNVTPSYRLGGAVNGLAGSGLVLRNNGGDPLAIGVDGVFTFAPAYVAGSAYAVTVGSQPVGQTCTVGNGSGTLSADVANVTVGCVTNGGVTTHTVGGTASGLAGGGLQLLLNGGHALTVAANGGFTFGFALTQGSSYSVTVGAQSSGQTCTVGSGSGTLNGDVSGVSVSCTTAGGVTTRSLGGTVSGLAGSGLVLHNNGGDALAIGADGAFAFAPAYVDGSTFVVTIGSQPVGQTCTVGNGSGTLNADVSDVALSCTTNGGVATHSLGGAAAGLAGSGLVLQVNGGYDLSVTALGAFTFGTAFTEGSGYAVTIASQPVGQTCTVGNGSGTLNADVSNVALNCTTNGGHAVHSLGGTATGLAGSGLVLRVNGGYDLAVMAAGTFTFSTAFTEGSGYAVTIASQPVGQTCTLGNANGTLAGAVSDVAVNCSTNGGVASHSLGGVATGLAGSGLVLQLNGGYDLAVTAAGPFNFGTALTEGSSYAVTIASQPVGQTCSVTSGSGTLAGAVSDIAVACATNGGVATHTLGGVVSGLAGSGLQLQVNGGYTLAIVEDGGIVFGTAFTEGSGYAVTIYTQPAGQTCTVGNGSGTLSGDVSDVAVSCATDGGVATHAIGGTVSGLAGSGLQLLLNGGHALSVTADGNFTFGAALTQGSGYSVTVGSQPVGQTCSVAHASGILAADVSDVTVSCATNGGVTSHTVGGSVAGLAGSGLQLLLNGGAALPVGANGSFTFGTPFTAGSAYTVTVGTQPVGQTCTVGNGSGTLAGDVSDVAVSCATQGGVVSHSLGGTATGLAGSGLVLRVNGGYDLPVTAAGPFAFATAFTEGSSYVVTIASQSVGQTCTVGNGSGTLAGDVSDIAVACTTNGGVASHTIAGAVSGLAGSGLQLQVNGGYTLSIVEDGGFVFGTALTEGSSYVVTISGQPVGQACTVGNGSGTLSADVSDVTVSCATDGGVTTHTIGGTVSGLAGGGLQLLLNGGHALSVAANGSFSFGIAFTQGSAYAVTVGTQPSGQTCTVTNGDGMLNADVANVAVSCATAGGVTTHSLGGTVSGLAGSGLILHNNGGDALAIGATGAFAFAPVYVHGSIYAVTVAGQPVGQACTVANGSGTLNGGVSDVTVSCATLGGVVTHAVGGTVSGLAGSGLQLLLNGGYALAASHDGGFAFGSALTQGSAYAVTVGNQPVGQTCMVTNGAGTLAGDVSNVAVTCATDGGHAEHSLGGTATGLAGSGLVLQVNGGYDLSVTAAGPFTFGTVFTQGSSYVVTVASQPVGQTCTVANGSGTLDGDVSDIAVDCATDGGVATRTIAGTVSGLAGSGLQLLLNGGYVLAPTHDGGFVFGIALTEGSAYTVTVGSQPVGQTCTVANGGGTLNGDVSDVGVSCATDGGVATHALDGTVSGLSGSGLQLLLNGGYALPVAVNGGFTFGTAFTEGSSYEVTVGSQPLDPDQTCTVSGGSGTLTAAVSDVSVQCATHQYAVQATAGAGGSVASANPLSIFHGQAAAFTVAPGAGYARLNPVSGDCPEGSWSGNTYTTGIVVQACSVTFAFALTSIEPPPVGQPGAGTGIVVTTPGDTSQGAWVFDPDHPPVFVAFEDAVDGNGQPIPPPPGGYRYPYEMLEFRLIQGAAGSAANVAITYAEPLTASAVFWKYGYASEADRLAGHMGWYRLPEDAYRIEGNTLTLFLSDGVLGDDDWTANRVIVDPGILGIANPVDVPVLDRWGAMLLSVLLLLAGWNARRHRG